MPRTMLSFRCDAELARAVRAKAKRDKVPLSVAVRLSLQQYVQGTRAPVETARQLGRVREQLLAVGRNINQIAKSIHAGYGPRNYARQTQELSRVLARLVRVIGPLGLPGKAERS